MADNYVPTPGNSFSLEWKGKADKIASFKSVDGLDDETDVLDTTESGPKGKTITLKVPGAMMRKSGSVTVKYNFRGKAGDDPLFTWRKEVTEGKVTDIYKDCSVVLYGVDDTEVFRWTIHKCWPSKYSMSSLSASSNDPVEITVILTHNGIEAGK